MKRSRLLFSLVVALAFGTFLVTTVMAEGELPGRTPPTLGGEIIPDATPDPAMNYLTYDTTPDFRFTELVGATKYKIEVYNSYDDSLLYTYKGVGICEGGYCTLTPDTVLGIYKWNKTTGLDSTTGIYYWRVKAKYAGMWQATWSDTSYILVLSEGFVSTFNVDKVGWKYVNGAWSRVAPGYIKAPGEDDRLYSAFQKNYTWDFVYQVKMKRTTSLNDANAIIFWGYPTLEVDYEWTNGIYFQYTNNQSFAIWKNVNGTWSWIQGWTTSTTIRPYEWNTLSVVVMYPQIYFFINGRYIGWYSITAPSVGWAGVSFYGSQFGEFMVDKATLEALQTYPSMVADPAMELGKEPVPEGMVPWQSPGE